MSAWAVSFRLKQHSDSRARDLGQRIEYLAQRATEYAADGMTGPAAQMRREMDSDIRRAQEFLA